jgi:hypothetical protein
MSPAVAAGKGLTREASVDDFSTLIQTILHITSLVTNRRVFEGSARMHFVGNESKPNLIVVDVAEEFPGILAYVPFLRFYCLFYRVTSCTHKGPRLSPLSFSELMA